MSMCTQGPSPLRGEMVLQQDCSRRDQRHHDHGFQHRVHLHLRDMSTTHSRCKGEDALGFHLQGYAPSGAPSSGHHHHHHRRDRPRRIAVGGFRRVGSARQASKAGLNTPFPRDGQIACTWRSIREGAAATVPCCRTNPFRIATLHGVCKPCSASLWGSG